LPTLSVLSIAWLSSWTVGNTPRTLATSTAIAISPSRAFASGASGTPIFSRMKRELRNWSYQRCVRPLSPTPLPQGERG